MAGFYTACLDSNAWPDILRRLCSSVRADACAVTVHDLATGVARLDRSIGIDERFAASYSEQFGKLNPWLQAPEQLPPPGVVTTGQALCDDSDVLASRYYSEWARPQDLFHHLFGILDTEGSVVSALMIARSQEKGAFWDDDIALINRLLPHLRQGLRAGSALRRAQELGRVQAHALELLPIGVAVVSTIGRVLFANRLAREIVSNETVFYSGNNGLGLKLPSGRVLLRDYLVPPLLSTENEAISEVQATSVPREGGRRPLSLLAIAADSDPMTRDFDDPAAIVFIGDPERPSEVDPKRLIRLYGLSRAEARVAVQLAKGQRLEQVAETLGLTYETVRKHLKQIFSKTFTDRQAELVRTLSLGPSGLRL
ncbi:MAG: helix-turn-helix transcriptional regulator [Rhodospirillales bacterium]|nr:helix-turn-helix transcriptional regulator [Rhodospirillales bacterium]